MEYHLHGLADIENNTAVTAKTLFEIGSVTKPLVALAALRQVQAGHWQLQQPVSTLTDTPELATHSYTLADLLTHRSGLPRLPGNFVTELTNEGDPAASATRTANPYARYDSKALLAAAGSQEFSDRHYSYSNYGYGLLGYLLAQQQQKLDAVLQECRAEIQRTSDAAVRAQAQEQLNVGSLVFEQLLALRSDQLQQAAQVLAADFGFKEAVASGDAPTIRSALANQGARINADAVFKGTKVDGVYDTDPVENPDAKMYQELTYIEVLKQGLNVMDSTAISLCMDNGLAINVFNITHEGNIKRIVSGEKIGTQVKKEVE